MLRALLRYAHENESVTALAEAARRAPQRAFVSASLRPYLLASLLDLEPERPALVIAGDDRAARDLAADLRAYLAPRKVRFYPARGMRYESHLAPPPHLVGLRIAALDALLDSERPAVVVASAAALSEKVPDPDLRPHGFEIEKGALLDLDEVGARLVGVRVRASRPGGGPRAVRDPRRHPRRLSGHRGARGALRALRHRGRAAHVVLHLHPALARGGGASSR